MLSRYDSRRQATRARGIAQYEGEERTPSDVPVRLPVCETQCVSAIASRFIVSLSPDTQAVSEPIPTSNDTHRTEPTGEHRVPEAVDYQPLG